MGIRIIPRKGREAKSAAHNVALRTFRRRKYAGLIITKEMVEDVLLKFKKQ